MMASTVPTEFVCTFKDCGHVFGSKAALITHKVNKSDHDYCKICDSDFKSEKAFFIHKLESKKHICCPVCGENFRSLDGKRLHFRQVRRGEHFNCKDEN